MDLLQSILNILIWLLVILLVYQIIIRVIRKLFHFPAPAFIGRFLDSDYRRKLQPPDQIIKGSGIQPGMHVLEIGCGSGAYTTFVSRVVGPEGQVEALDIQAAMLDQLEIKLNKPEFSNIKNIRTHLASAYQLPFEKNSLDLVYLITVLAEIPDQQKALLEIKRVLKPGGILAVSEFLPDPDYSFKETTARRVTNTGFDLEGFYGNFWAYTARFIKP
jgi:ubiquinone/menaquinone biosynthesis C-methylase UbiE